MLSMTAPAETTSPGSRIRAAHAKLYPTVLDEKDVEDVAAYVEERIGPYSDRYPTMAPAIAGA
jgi:hypothetical protein